MRVMGYNVLAVLGAAVAIYLVGALIYGVMIDPETWMRWAGIDKAQMDAVGMSRMPYSPIMPLVTAGGLAVLFRWVNVADMATGIRIAGLVALFSAVMAIWYGWVYGTGPCAGALLDSAHLFLGHVVAGAILGRWR